MFKNKMMNQIIIFYIYIYYIKSQKTITREDLENPFLYKNEICSYNGNPNMISDENGKISIECSCYSSYVNEPRENYKKYIGDQIVQCSYQRKKRFTTFFLAGLIPMGFDYFYLELYLYFVIVFFGFISIIINNIVCFLLSYKLKEMYEESKYQYNDRSDNLNRNNLFFKSNKKKDKKEQLKKCIDIYRIINRIFIIISVIYWIVDIVLQARGIIKDKNGIETENDMNSLFSREET